jgi:hypothetical protein
MSGGSAILVLGLLATALTASAPSPSLAGDVCADLWTVGGGGDGKPWQFTEGYRVGMAKPQALQIRRVGLRTSEAQNEWVFILSMARIVLIFEDGKLAAASVIFEATDYQEVYVDLYELHGMPDDIGRNYVVWRSEECDTAKILLDEGDLVTLAIQSLDYHERSKGGGATTGKKKKRKKKG